MNIDKFQFYDKQGKQIIFDEYGNMKQYAVPISNYVNNLFLFIYFLLYLLIIIFMLPDTGIFGDSFKYYNISVYVASFLSALVLIFFISLWLMSNISYVTGKNLMKLMLFTSLVTFIFGIIGVTNSTTLSQPSTYNSIFSILILVCSILGFILTIYVFYLDYCN